MPPHATPLTPRARRREGGPGAPRQESRGFLILLTQVLAQAHRVKGRSSSRAPARGGGARAPRETRLSHRPFMLTPPRPCLIARARAHAHACVCRAETLISQALTLTLPHHVTTTRGRKREVCLSPWAWRRGAVLQCGGRWGPGPGPPLFFPFLFFLRVEFHVSAFPPSLAFSLAARLRSLSGGALRLALAQ